LRTDWRSDGERFTYVDGDCDDDDGDMKLEETVEAGRQKTVRRTRLDAWTDPELRRSIAGKTVSSTVIIPVGSIEQHGPHLPASTDADIATEVARRVAENNGYLLLPTVMYGVSYEHAPFLNISLQKETLGAVLRDLLDSLHENHMEAVIVINGHHGNIGALEGLGRPITYNVDMNAGTVKVGDNPDGKSHTDIPIMVGVVHYWRFIRHELGHAGFAETSMMLAISPKAVRMDLAERGLDTENMPREELKRLSELSTRSFLEATGNGIWGDPTGATREDGMRILKEAADGISKECERYLASRMS